MHWMNRAWVFIRLIMIVCLGLCMDYEIVETPVVVVEHDADTLLACDHLIEVGQDRD
jgi:hypothetical protein